MHILATVYIILIRPIRDGALDGVLKKKPRDDDDARARRGRRAPLPHRLPHWQGGRRVDLRVGRASRTQALDALRSRDDEIFARPSDRPKGTRQLVHDADVIMGHFTPASDRRGRFVDALRRRNFTRRCAVWTILRDPLDLQASMLAFLYGRHPDVWNDCLAGPTLDGDGPCTHRTQRRRHPLLRDSLCHTFDGQMDHWNTYNFNQTGPWPPPCRYESAQRALEALDGVGFTESMNESVIQPWVRHLGLSDRAPPYEATHATRSNRGFDALSTQIQRTITETSRDDILLYRWARRRRA